MGHNAIKEIREGLLMNRAELARKAEVSFPTIYRVEKGGNPRAEANRKLLLALGYNFSDKDKVFPVAADN